MHVAVVRGVGEPIYELPYCEDHHPTRSPDKEPRTYLKISRAQLSRLDTPQDQSRPLLRRTPTDGMLVLSRTALVGVLWYVHPAIVFQQFLQSRPLSLATLTNLPA